MKKTFGYIFFIIAAFLILVTLFQFSDVIKNAVTIFLYFAGNNIDDYTFGYSVGSLCANFAIIAIAIVLFVIGLKWIKRID